MDQQLRLPLNQPREEVVAIRSIDWRVTGISEHRWRHVREILIAIVYCGSRNGCSARSESLLRVANENREHCTPAMESLRSFERRHADGVRLGLIESVRQFKRPSLRSINTKTVAQMVKLSRDLAQKKVAEQVADGWRDYGGTSGGTINPNNPIKPLRTQTTGRQATKNTNWTKALDDALHVRRKIGRPRSQADASLVLKAAALSQHLSERWLHDATEGVVQCNPKNRFAYFQSLLADGCSDLNRRMAQQRIPQEVFQEFVDYRPARRSCEPVEI